MKKGNYLLTWPAYVSPASPHDPVQASEWAKHGSPEHQADDPKITVQRFYVTGIETPDGKTVILSSALRAGQVSTDGGWGGPLAVCARSLGTSSPSRSPVPVPRPHALRTIFPVTSNQASAYSAPWRNPASPASSSRGGTPPTRANFRMEDLFDAALANFWCWTYEATGKPEYQGRYVQASERQE